MKERIQELALQCGAWNQVYMHKSLLMNEHFDIEKFAELIVRECANKLENDGMVEVAMELKEHFGVEL